MNKRKFYDLDDLYNFCKKNKFEKFNSQTMGAPLVVQTIGTFEAETSDTEGLMPVKLKSCHTGKNLNQSFISDDVMNAAKPSFKGRPILGAIYLTDTGEYEFRGHDLEVDDEGNIEYIEQPVGVISQIEEPYLEYDAEADKSYLMVSGTIFTEYSHAAEILERRKTCACSVEIAVKAFSYSIEEDCLSIDDMTFMGVTILGTQQDGETKINPGMAGSNITISDFSAENNSVFSAIDTNTKLVEVLDKLNTTLSSLNTNSEKGGDFKMGKFEELLEKYNKKIEDITFEYENLTDEELEAKFAELFEDGDDAGAEGDTTSETPETTEEPVAEEENEDEGIAPLSVEEPEADPEAEDADDFGCKKKRKCELTYELSHDETRSALYELLRAECGEEACWCTWIVDVYDSYFIYEDYNEVPKYYRQKYTKDAEALKFEGERVAVFSEWLTQEEKDALAALKADYAALKSFKEQYDASEVKAAKDAIFEAPEYAELKDSEEFQSLVADAEKYSVEELKVKCELLFAKFAKQKLNFSMNEPEKKNSVGINLGTQPNPRNQAYAGLFSE